MPLVRTTASRKKSVRIQVPVAEVNRPRVLLAISLLYRPAAMDQMASAPKGVCNMIKSARFLALCASLLPALAGAAGPIAGTVTLASGRGTASDPSTGTIRALAKGDTVYSGEIISSAANTFINIRYQDGGYTLIRPNSRFEISDYKFEGTAADASAADAPPAPATPAPADGTSAPPSSPITPPKAVQTGPSRAFFKLLKGGFRAVSGAIGKATREEYRVSTPVATIGIRGTDYEVDICDAACANDPVIRRTIEQRARAQLDGMELAAAEDLMVSDAGTGSDSFVGTEIVSVNEGDVDYTNTNTNINTPVTQNQTLITTPDGGSSTTDQKPPTLAKPDPQGNACN